MLKTVRQLVEAAQNGDSRKTLANHRFLREGNKYRFYYHDTNICTVTPEDQTISFSHGGWKTPSTNRAINSYREAFPEYLEVEHG